MPQPHAGPLSATAAAAAHHRPKRSGFAHACRKAYRGARWIPGFLWILLLYVGMQNFVIDMRAPFVSLSTYSIAWVEVLYVVAFAAAILELLKVSSPGNNDTGQALMMTGVLVGYIVFFTLGAAGIYPMTVFATSEFIILTFVSGIQVIMAFWINSATLQRTIGQSGHDHDDY